MSNGLGGLLRTARLDDPDHGRGRTGPRTCTGPWRAGGGPAGNCPAAWPTARGSDGSWVQRRCRPGARNVHDWLHAACMVAPVHGAGPSEPACTDQADHEGGPAREGSGSREPGGPAVSGPAIATVSAGDVDAAAVAAYRASLWEGKPAVRAQAGRGIRQDLTAVGAQPDGGSQARTSRRLTANALARRPEQRRLRRARSDFGCSQCLLQSEHGWDDSRHGRQQPSRRGARYPPLCSAAGRLASLN